MVTTYLCPDSPDQSEVSLGGLTLVSAVMIYQSKKHKATSHGRGVKPGGNWARAFESSPRGLTQDMLNSSSIEL